MFYTGIGSRNIPEHIRQGMTDVATKLAAQGYTLRSGGADGADLAFEAGAGDKKEIYLPWKGFNGSDSPLFVKSFPKDIQEKQKEFGKKYHPVFDVLSFGGQCMMRRNAHQILGMDLNTPTDFVVCWTANGKDMGGTGFAIRIAWDLGIPVYNLHDETQIKKLYKERIRNAEV